VIKAKKQEYRVNQFLEILQYYRQKSSRVKELMRSKNKAVNANFEGNY
jgi:hypothetical protein